MTKPRLIDKIAFIHLKDGQILMALSKGKSTYYIPGGKRDPGETDEETLLREVKEELNVELDSGTISYYGTFKAQAHGKSEGVEVQMTCYQAEFSGSLAPSSEIESIGWYNYAQMDIVGPVDQIIFDDLKAKGLIS